MQILYMYVLIVYVPANTTLSMHLLKRLGIFSCAYVLLRTVTSPFECSLAYSSFSDMTGVL